MRPPPKVRLRTRIIGQPATARRACFKSKEGRVFVSVSSVRSYYILSKAKTHNAAGGFSCRDARVVSSHTLPAYWMFLVVYC